MVFFVSGFALGGVIAIKFFVSKVLHKTLERCMPPDHEKSEMEADSSDEEACDHGQDVPELAAQAVDNDDEEHQQPMVGATNRTVGILWRILRWVLNTGIDVVMTMPRIAYMIYRLCCARCRRQGEGREPTLTEGRLLSGSNSSTGTSTGYNSLDSPSDSCGEGGEGGDDAARDSSIMITNYLFFFYV